MTRTVTVKDAQAWTTVGHGGGGGVGWLGAGGYWDAVYARCKKLAWSSSRKGLADEAEEAIEDGSGGGKEDW